MFNRSLNETLLVVDVPPQVPHPKVIDGTRPVVSPNQALRGRGIHQDAADWHGCREALREASLTCMDDRRVAGAIDGEQPTTHPYPFVHVRDGEQARRPGRVSRQPDSSRRFTDSVGTTSNWML